MKQINKYIVERLRINKDIGNHDHHYNYYPKDKNELKELVNKLIKERGNEADLNDIDTSEITDMSHMFTYSKFIFIFRIIIIMMIMITSIFIDM